MFDKEWRDWHSLRVCIPALGGLVKDHFPVDHTAVSAQQRAESLERWVEYDHDALSEAWGHQGSSSCDGEEDQLFFQETVFSRQKGDE